MVSHSVLKTLFSVSLKNVQTVFRNSYVQALNMGYTMSRGGLTSPTWSLMNRFWIFLCQNLDVSGGGNLKKIKGLENLPAQVVSKICPRVPPPNLNPRVPPSPLSLHYFIFVTYNTRTYKITIL